MTDTDPATPTITIDPPPLAETPRDEPMTSVTSQIGLAVVAVFTILAFIFHTDFSSIVPAVSVLAISVYGAAVAVARAIKHRTMAQATMLHNQQRLEVWREQKDQTLRAQGIHPHTLTPLTFPVKKTAARKTTTRQSR